MRRRHPACGSEVEHGAHSYACDYRADGTILGIRPQEGWCVGWTADEADLCAMIRQVHVLMLELSPPDGTRTFRVECSQRVLAGLHMLFLQQVSELSGAELVVISRWEPGRWQLTETPQVLAAGTVRPEPAAAVYPGLEARPLARAAGHPPGPGTPRRRATAPDPAPDAS